MGGEVSKEVLTGMAAVVDKLGLEPRTIFGPILDDDGQFPDRADFEALVPIFDRLAAHLPPDQRMEELGTYTFEVPALFHPLRALGLFLDPSKLLVASTGNIRRFFSNIESSVERTAEGVYRVTYRLKDGTSASPNFFRFQAGVIAGLPRLLGLPTAAVKVEADSNSAVFGVELPRSRTLIARLGSFLWVLRNGHSALEALAEQSAALRANNEKLRHEIDERRRAEEALELANRELEARIRERTAALAARNEEQRLILDNAVQGFVTVDADGRMSVERSQVLNRWLGIDENETTLPAALARHNPLLSEWVQEALATIRDELVPLEVALTQLPAELMLGPVELTLEPHPVGGHDDRILLVFSNVGPERARERERAYHEELLIVMERATVESVGISAFLAETDALIARVEMSDPARAVRALHSLKGNARLQGLNSLAALFHALEDDLRDGARLDPIRWRELKARWASARSLLARLVAFGGDGGFRRSALDSLLKSRDEGADYNELRRLTRALTREPIGPRLEQLGAEARRLAARLGRAELQVDIEGGELLVDPKEHGGVLSALVHAVRNAVDHGLEKPEERILAGKPEQGRVRLAAGETGGGWRLIVEDDGRGIDVAALRSRLGAPELSTSDLLLKIFEDFVSSRTEVSEISGRGIGLSALREEVEALGGRCSIETVPGQGTRLRFDFPSRSNARSASKPSRCT